MWRLCVLCVLLSPIQGQDPGGSNWTEIITRVGSNVLLSPMYNRTMDKEKNTCDTYEWLYGLSRIYRRRECHPPDIFYTELSNFHVSEFGILTLINVTRKNSGNYKVTVTKSSGKTSSHNYNLQVQAPVSKPFLFVSCLPDGGANISCRTDNGTDPCFSITVNGDVRLNSTSSRTDGDEVHVPVDSPGPWNITCSVRNKVSENETKKDGEMCPVPLSDPILNGSCLYNGSRDVSCLVENGTNPDFSLYVNGTLIKNVREERKRVNDILSSPGGWYVECSVKNELGTKRNNNTFLSCPAPPSQPILHDKCLHDGRLQISCSVEKGTDLNFTLSVNGTSQNVTGGKKMVNVTLPSPGPWGVHCFVRNILDKKNISKIFPDCEGSVGSSKSQCYSCLQKSLFGAAVALTVTIFSLLIASCYSRRNKKED